ncbi:MAG: general secretion pathway protein GspC [Paraburkholderia sp.]|uniref:general secretion pathway protein GspC n=1 Tax=Paraburkholderia sp. TaxID=1926495 RepID=UPI00121976C9|nr:general secretion pathway protein GspC [Paraburkholderia sp.]TAM02581.1 MAG: general secretion pathway protein GspC [Paraburkholderia sp.]TAM28695.1 MAG: general secretion pathway protein GspC [Paraburkholderia sp.]
MAPTSRRLLTLAAFAVLCATSTHWVVTLATTRARPVEAAAAEAPVSLNEAARLFGGTPQKRITQNIHLFGILALEQGAAAIVSTDGEPAKAVSLGGALGQDTTLAEVRPRSIVIDRHGANSEIFLPANSAGPTIYVR